MNHYSRWVFDESFLRKIRAAKAIWKRPNSLHNRAKLAGFMVRPVREFARIRQRNMGKSDRLKGEPFSLLRYLCPAKLGVPRRGQETGKAEEDKRMIRKVLLSWIREKDQ